WLGPVEIDGKKSVLQARARHAHAFGKHEAALELARGDAAVQKVALGLVGLAAAHEELVLLGGDVEVAFGEPRDGKCYAQLLRFALGAAQSFDVVGRIGIAGLRQTLQRLFHGIESKQKRTRK